MSALEVGTPIQITQSGHVFNGMSGEITLVSGVKNRMYAIVGSPLHPAWIKADPEWFKVNARVIARSPFDSYDQVGGDVDDQC